MHFNVQHWYIILSLYANTDFKDTCSHNIGRYVKILKYSIRCVIQWLYTLSIHTGLIFHEITQHGEKKRKKNEKKKDSRFWDSNPGPPDHEAKYIPLDHRGLLYKWLPVNGIVHVTMHLGY